MSFILDTIESENDFLYLNINEHIIEKKNLKRKPKNLEQSDNEICLIDLFVHLLLSLNLRYVLPEENILMGFIIGQVDEPLKDYKILSEKLLNLFNFECNF